LTINDRVVANNGEVVSKTKTFFVRVNVAGGEARITAINGGS